MQVSRPRGLRRGQREIVAKLDRIAPYTKGFGWASVGLLLLIAGFSMYQAFTRFQSGQ